MDNLGLVVEISVHISTVISHDKITLTNLPKKLNNFTCLYVIFPVSADFRNAAPSEREPPWGTVVQGHHGGSWAAWGCTGKPHEDPKVRLIRSKPDARLGRPVGRRSWGRTPGAPSEPFQAQHGSRRNLGLKRQVCPLATILFLTFSAHK